MFQLNPEVAHDLTLGLLDRCCSGPIRSALQARAPRCPCSLLGLEFPNPVGLAAGMDKNGDHIDALGALGFGFIEVGTVTPRPQTGNPRPRLFRLPAAQALINRMGFNNQGVDYLVERLQHSRYRGVIGVNIGKNVTTPLERAVDDYVTVLRKVYPYTHYVVVNISSPNTPGLRDLQQNGSLDGLLERLTAEQTRLASAHGRRVPLAVKIAPDLTPEAIARIGRTLLEQGIDAVIATNTTIGREGVAGLPQAAETGGLSGAPLRERAIAAVRCLHESTGGRLPIIAVGGILSGADAQASIEAGASLVQLYTGLVYRGPSLIREVVEALRAPVSATSLPHP
jgi:dihydroorotate dehydrogenase